MDQCLVNTIREGRTHYDLQHNVLHMRKPRTYSSRKSPEFRFVQAKCDGYRVVLVKRLEGRRVHVITSTGHDIGMKCENTLWYRMLQKKGGDMLHLDAEICIPGKGREAVSTALAERSNELRLMVFGCSGVPASASLAEVDRFVTSLKCHLDVPAWSPIGDCAKSNGVLKQYTESADAALERIGAMGAHYDGVVFKNGMYLEWAKLKHIQTVDAVIMGIKGGKGKYTNMCGSLKCGVYFGDELREIARVSGMDDDLREGITDADIGRVVEIKYERVGTRGRLQHPRFVAWRTDKLAKDCNSEQLG